MWMPLIDFSMLLAASMSCRLYFRWNSALLWFTVAWRSRLVNGARFVPRGVLVQGFVVYAAGIQALQESGLFVVAVPNGQMIADAVASAFAEVIPYAMQLVIILSSNSQYRGYICCTSWTAIERLCFCKLLVRQHADVFYFEQMEGWLIQFCLLSVPLLKSLVRGV